MMVVADDGDSNLSNTASLLWHAFKSMPGASAEVNWAGEWCFLFTFPLPPSPSPPPPLNPSPHTRRN